MNRLTLFSGALALAVASIAVNEIHAAPPPTTQSPGAVQARPPATAIVQKLHPPRPNVQRMPQDTPHPTLTASQKADGPTLVLEPVAPSIAGKASLLMYASGDGTTGLFSPADDAIEISHGCGSSQCVSTSMAVTEVSFARDASHGYVVTCLLANTGSNPVDVTIYWGNQEQVQTVAAGHSSWMTHDYRPATLDGNYSLMTFGSTTKVSYSITRCEIMPYVGPRG